MPRLLKPAAAAVAALALAAIVVGVSSASPRSHASSAPSPPATATATLVPRLAAELRTGSTVSSRTLGVRSFANALDGFALANVDQGTYPAATVNGGKTWKTDGPALHVNAAQAPLVVLQAGVANKHTFFAYGGPGGGQAVDVTPDGGKHWWRTLFSGEVAISVVADPHGHLVAFDLAPASNTGSTVVTWVYVSTDGGRHWRYTKTLPF